MSLTFPSKQNLTFLLKSLVKECPLHGPQMRPIWRKTPSSRALLNISFRVPIKEPPRFPLQSSHRERRSVSRALLCPSLEVPGKGAPSSFPNRAHIEKYALFRSLPLHILQVPLPQLPKKAMPSCQSPSSSISQSS